MNTFRRLLINAVCALALVAAIEGTVAFGLSRPDLVSRLPLLPRVLMRGIYLDGGRNIIQYEPDCSRYDARLTYTLKPGRFVFSNIEFNTPYEVNRLGIRSSESALEDPDIIVIGDSRAMGWGIAQHELYSKILGDLSGRRTLNAAVSSFGTVREMRLLDLLDISAARTIIIHYVANDYEENAHYFKHGNTLQISDEARYLDVREKYLKSKRYYFGKYAFFFFYRLAAEVRNGLVKAMGIDELDQDVIYFLNALVHARQTPLDGKQLILMGDSDFIKRLRHEIDRGIYPDFVKKATLASDDVPENGYFTLDNHMNSRGHRILAERLNRFVR